MDQLSENRVLKRGAYGGIVYLVIFLPTFFLGVLNSDRSLSTPETILLLILSIILPVAGLFITFGFIQLARRHSVKFLLVMSYLIGATIVLSGIHGVVRIWNMSKDVELMENILFLIYLLVLLVTAFAIAKLYPHYGKIALTLRNFQILETIGFGPMVILIFFGVKNPVIGLVIILLGIIGIIGWLGQAIVSVLLLLRASRATAV